MIPSAVAIRWGIWLSSRVPAAVVRGGARLAGRIAGTVARGRRRTIATNMDHLVADRAMRGRLGRLVLPNMLEAVTDLWRLPTLDRDALDRLVDVRGLEHLDAAVAAGHGVILATAHLGPYELAGAWLAHRGYVVHAMVERMPEETGAALAAYRSSTGMQLLDRSSGPRGLLRVLKAGEVAALVCDRMVGAGAPGQVVPFGRGFREIPVGPASFALASGARIVTGSIVRNPLGPGRYQLSLDPPVDPAGHTVVTLTTLIGERLSAMASAHADEWYVFQPAWRK